MAINQITVEIENQTYAGWESVEIYDDMEQLGNTFTLNTSIPSDINLAIQPGQSLVVKIDNEPMLSGYVDTVEINESATSSQMTITGRDKVCDFVDSRVSNKTFTPPIGFVEILTKLLRIVGYEVVSPYSLSNPLAAKLGANKISIINNYEKVNGSIPMFETNEGIGFSPGESAYELIKRLADKRGLVLGTDGKGNITIDAIGVNYATTTLQRLQEDSTDVTNNIVTANVKNSWASRFYEYKIASKGTGGVTANISSSDKNKTDAQKAILDPIKNDTVSYSATVYDDSIRQTRKFYAVVPSLTNSQCEDRAKWELNIRKAKNFNYVCKVAGFRQNLITQFSNNSLNPLWEINTKVYLVDQRFNLDGEYLIKSVKYRQSISEGSTCELTLIDEYSYTYSIFKPLIKRGKKSINSQSILFNDPV